MTSDEARDLALIVGRVADVTGLDLNDYKPSVTLRRVRHRVALVSARSIREYRELLQQDSAEIFRLLDALLIKTTAPFRDRASFAFLRQHALPALLARRVRQHRQELRAWVAGCSTGEEAYSIAMCLLEASEGTAFEPRVLASDFDSAALERAACALLQTPDQVPIALATRWLSPEPEGARVVGEARACVSVAHHNLLAPSARAPRESVLATFDLVSCRNLLIYLTPDAQTRLMQRLLSACEPGSLLMLGESERPPASLARSLRQLCPEVPVYAVD